MLTHGTDSPAAVPAVVAELAKLMSAAHVEVLNGAAHIPHATHPDEWVARITAFHQQHQLSRRQQRRISRAGAPATADSMTLADPPIIAALQSSPTRS